MSFRLHCHNPVDVRLNCLPTAPAEEMTLGFYSLSVDRMIGYEKR